jgi:hypothetical protein
MTTAELTAQVRKLWAQPEYHMLQEVRNQTGFGNGQVGYADVLAMSIWPSRGIRLIGAELKVSRQDWIHEKKKPSKAEPFVQFCHNWWLITGPDVAVAEELPRCWGWMEFDGKRLKTRINAPDMMPIPITHEFLASIFRNLSDQKEDFVMRKDVEAEVNKRLVQEREYQGRVVEQMREKLKESEANADVLRKCIHEFNDASGCSIDQWRPDPQKAQAEAKLFKAFRDDKIDAVRMQIRRYLSCIDQNLYELREAIEESEKVKL